MLSLTILKIDQVKFEIHDDEPLEAKYKLDHRLFPIQMILAHTFPVTYSHLTQNWVLGSQQPGNK